MLLREGIARLLSDAGFDVVAQAGDAEDLLRKGLAHRPDVAVVDIQMPPGHGDDGLQAALELRRAHSDVGILVLSQYYEEAYAVELIGDRPEGVGYLLKERVGDVGAMRESLSKEVLRVPRLGHHVEACVAKKARDPLAQQHVVLTDYNSKRLGHGRTTVPPRSALG